MYNLHTDTRVHECGHCGNQDDACLTAPASMAGSRGINVACVSVVRGWEIAQLVRVLGIGERIPVTAITFSCAAFHFPAVYNLQHHQRPVPLTPGLYGVGG